MIKKSIFTVLILFLLISDISLFITDSSEAAKSSNETMDFPSDLQVGDLLFCDVRPTIEGAAQNYELYLIQSLEGYSNDHVAMYVGNNRFIESAPYIFRPLRGEWIGVTITPYWLLELWAKNFTFAYVETDQDTRDAAVEWAKARRGEPYSDEGYRCADLIFEAYKSQNVMLHVKSLYSNRTYNATYPYGLRIADNVTMYSNIPPIAEIYTDTIHDMIDQQIYLDGEATDKDGRVVNFRWDFGDGNYLERSGRYVESIYHQYDTAGNYTVTLTVTDNYGDKHTDTCIVSIRDYDDEEPDDSEDDSENDNNSNKDSGGNNEKGSSSEEIVKLGDFTGFLIILAIILLIAISLIFLIWVLRK
jgi:uncharacterized protein YycO